MGSASSPSMGATLRQNPPSDNSAECADQTKQDYPVYAPQGHLQRPDHFSLPELLQSKARKNYQKLTYRITKIDI